MPDNSRINGEFPSGTPNENLEYILANGGLLTEEHLLKERIVLQNDFIWPDGTEYPKGFTLPAGMVIPAGSIVKKSIQSPPAEEKAVEVSGQEKCLKDEGESTCDDSWEFGQSHYKVVPNISIIGVGGAGGNTIARIAETKIQCANLFAINTAVTDMMRLGKNVKKGLIGASMTKGLGAGGDLEKGKKAASGDRVKIEEMLKGTNLLFISAGMGGGTGTGAAPVVAEISKGFEDCTTIAVVTFPFDHEGGYRKESARKGIAELRKYVDTVVIVDNSRLEKLYGTRTVGDALKQADDIITTAITSIAETVAAPQNSVNEISLDYADIRTIMKGGGKGKNVAVMCLGHGRNIKDAVENTISKPLLDVSYEGATSALIHIIGGPDMKLADTTEIGRRLTNGLKLNPNAQIIWGIRVKEDMGERIDVITIFNGVKCPQILGDEYSDWEELPESAMQMSDRELGIQSIMK